MIFEYQCQKCEGVFERDFRIGQAKSKVKCKKCGGNATRYFNAVNFKLEGSGWTDSCGKLSEKGKRIHTGVKKK